MRLKTLTSTILALAFILLSGSVGRASFPVGNVGTNVTVSFEFPDGTTNAVSLNYSAALAALTKKSLPKGVSVNYYMIDFWVYAALQTLDLPFKSRTVNRKTTIEQIGKAANGPDGEWIYYVNGIRSPYNINTQVDTDVRTIRFVYERKKTDRAACSPSSPSVFLCTVGPNLNRKEI